MAVSQREPSRGRAAGLGAWASLPPGAVPVLAQPPAWLALTHEWMTNSLPLFIALVTRKGAPPERRFLKMKVVSQVKLGGQEERLPTEVISEAVKDPHQHGGHP